MRPVRLEEAWKGEAVKEVSQGVLIMAQWLTNPTSIHEDAGLIPVLLSGLRTQHCHELWCRSQTQLGSGIAVAVVQASSHSSDWTPSLGIPYALGGALKKKKKKKRN